MPHSKPDAEDALEQAAIQLFADIGWRTVTTYHETYGSQGTLGPEHRGEVVLLRELRAALGALNPALSRAALDQAIEARLRDRGVLGMAQANREIYDLLKSGIKVVYAGDAGEQVAETVRVIDWSAPGNNRYLLVAQLWVAGEMHTRRADLAGFVNGLPVLFVELKAHTRNLKAAYDGNVKDYKNGV